MNRVLLARRDLVAEAARTRHTMEVEVVERDGLCWWRADVGSVVEVGDRVALLRLSGRGDLPMGYVAGRIYGVVERVFGPEGELYLALGDGPGAPRLALSGAGEARVGLLDLSRCPFLPLEGRISTEALRQEAAEREGEADAASSLRRALLVDLLGRAEMAVRGSMPTPATDLVWAKATRFLAVAGAVGLSGAEHPGHVLLALLERGEDEGEMFSAWDGWESRAGAESFAVCAWLCYFLSDYEGADLREAPQWVEVRGAYGV
jgi:hypothetical protein